MIVMPLFAAGMVAAGIAVIRFLNQRAKRDARELRELTERLEHQATHDSLTGLANRRGFEALLAAAIEARLNTDRGCALLYFDLDQIKVVNDSCGHAAGDELIRQVAWRVQRLAGEGCTMGRLGGDEFALLLPGHGRRCRSGVCRTDARAAIRPALLLERQDLRRQRQHRRAGAGSQRAVGGRGAQRGGPGLLHGQGQWAQSRAAVSP